MLKPFLVFPGSSSFGGKYEGKSEVIAWLDRFAALRPRIDVLDVAVSGPPWNTRLHGYSRQSCLLLLAHAQSCTGSPLAG